MGRHFFLFLFLLLQVTGWGQTATVVDHQSNETLVGVVLITDNPRTTAVTNALGQVDLTSFQNAAKIQINSIGYKTLVLSYDELDSLGFFIRMTPTSLMLHQVVVSASRWRQTSHHVPSKIISISPKEIALQNPQTAADLLGVSGKVFVQKSQQGGGSPMIRGFATNRLIYTVDGIRMNTAIFRGGNIQNVINLDPFATENAEVLFGPGSVIYGSDAIGGVMSFQTLTPHLSLDDTTVVSGKVVSRYSSANSEKTGHFDVNIGWKKWAVVSSFSAWDYDHLRQGSQGPDDYLKTAYPIRLDSMDAVITQEDPLLQIPSAYSQINLMEKVRFKPNEDWDFLYGLHYSTTSPYGRYDRHNRYQNGTLRYGEWNYGPQSWMMNHLQVYHQGHNEVYDQFTLRLGYQIFGESRITRSLQSHVRTTTTEKVHAYSANLDFTKSLKKHNDLFYGVEWVTNVVSSQGEFEDLTASDFSAGPSRYPEARWTSLAAYLNDEWEVTEELTLQGGVRYNHFLLKADFSDNLAFYPLPFTEVEINKGALTGSLGAVYRPSETMVFKVNAGTAFRSPNVDDMGKVFDSEPGAVTVPNPDLSAEYAYNVDVGVAKVFGDAVEVDMSGYYTLLNNALVRRNAQLNGLDSIFFDGELSQVQTLQNAAEARVYGLQVDVEVELPGEFEFVSDLNFQVGEEELDDGTVSPSRHAAPFYTINRLEYETNRLTLELNWMYQAKRTHENLPVGEQGKEEVYAKDSKGQTYSPAWYTLNLKALYQLTDLISVSAGIENLTDQRYRPYSSGISGAGRNFILSVRAEF